MQDNFILNSQEIHVWLACLPKHEYDISYFTSILSLDELEKAKRFRFEKDQKKFTITRGILRCLLSRYLQDDPQCIEINYGLWGKPTLLVSEPLHFNLSHSKDYVIYAVSRNYEVGIDIEYINKDLFIEDEMLKILFRGECIQWNELDSTEKTSVFFKNWVFKEAILKAYGKGWAGDINEMSHKTIFSPLTNPEKGSSNEPIYPSYLDFIPGYAGALFVLGPSLQPIYHIWDQTLMN